MAAPATTLSLSLSSFPIDPQNHHHHHRFFLSTTSPSKLTLTRPFTHLLPNFHIYPSPPLSSFKTPSSTPSHSHSPTTTTPPLPSRPSSSYDVDPFRTGRFLTNDELDKLRFLETFLYSQELKSGSMWVRVMRPDETDITVALLAESFADSMMLPSRYVGLLGFLVKKYIIERRALMPHMATLVGFYRRKGEEEEEEEGEVELAGTVEVCFDKRGANASLPSPQPPRDSPYICNMAVQKSLRRRGIGWHLLKASEELISQMSSSREVYLHCRMIDEAPFNMYIKADYKVVKTDSILVLLMLQRRKHLMCKKLPPSDTPSETDLSDSDE